MDITQAQRDQVQKWLSYASLRKPPGSSNETKTSGSAPGGITSWFQNEVAFATIVALNIPAFLKIQLIRVNASKQAIASWKRWSSATRSGRWTSGTLEWLGAKDRIIAINSHVRGALATHEWVDRLWLALKAPLYTWIISGFVHMEIGHLMSNMIALSSVAPICSRLPGMTALHVFAITFGSSVCASAALITESRFRLAPRIQQELSHAIGASAIVSAFIAVAAAGAPKSSLSLQGIGVPCWVLTMLQFGGDIAGMLRLDELMSGKQKSWLETMRTPRIGYAAHLGGASFGLIYYYGVLRRRAAMTSGSLSRSSDIAPK